ncbi:MAG: sulfatase-like hydrolase/transferase [Rhodopirellula sp.]|nr:sulfatase-like hydrolase/transferase [Rhodopirellula sp.]
MQLRMVIATILVFLGIPCLAADAVRKTNVVFILTDNQGAWTLGCYGNPDIQTPHIDRLAADGMLFSRAFASNAVCSPTRATYLTGLIPSQHGVHCFLDPKYMMGPEAYNTLAEFRSLPEILADHGYVCGLTGKWHLGANLTPQESFSYWITMVQGSTAEFYDMPVIEEGEVRKEPKYATDLWTEHAVRFIRQNKDRPFFLYLPYNGPYNLGPLLLNPARNRHHDYYADKPLMSFHRDAMHPWLFNNKDYLNNMVSIRRVAAETSAVDDGVGAVMAALEELGLEDDTLIVYAADQGWMGGTNGLWGMGDHTRPLTAFDRMMQVPLIFRHRGAISPGGKSDAMVSNYDFLPSVLSYLNLGDETGRLQPKSPGRDFSPLLRGQTIDWDNVVYYEMERVRAIRTDEWKYVHRPDGPYELYHLASDPFEKVNLYGQPQQATIQGELEQRLEHFFLATAEPKYDLYRGGGSKASLLSDREQKRRP